MKASRLLLSLSLLALLAACETSVEAPDTAGTSAAPAKANFRSKSSGTNYSNNDAPKSSARQIEEGEEDSAVLDAAEKMIKQGDFTSATVMYKRAVNANPKSISALKGLAKLYEAQDRPREALDSWRAVVAIDESDAEARRGMGRDFLAMGLYPKAIEALTKAHELGSGTPEDLKTVNLLAMAQLRGGDPNGAIDTLETAIKDNDDLATKNNLGFAYVMAGDLNKAIPILEEVVKDPKCTVQQRQNLALAYGLAGREEDARAIALQDLPPAAVANNLKSYREMRDKLNGKATPVVETPKPKKKAAPKKKSAAVPAASVPAPAGSVPAAAPTPAPVTSVPVPPPAPAAMPAPGPHGVVPTQSETR
jgi:Flp pilus assembly protein TadD